MDNETIINTMEDCSEVDKDYIVQRFILIVIFGVTLSIISILFNTFVFAVFVTNSQHRNSANLYMLLLALCDVFMGILFIAVIAVRIVFLWFSSKAMKDIWMTYVVPSLTLSHVVMTGSTYLIVFASIERFCTSLDLHRIVPILQKYRQIFAAIAIFFGLIAKGTMIWEIQVLRADNCIGFFKEYYIDRYLLSYNDWFNMYYRFYFRNIFSVLVPFFILMFLNICLVMRLRQQRKIAKKSEHLHEKESVKQKKARIMAVTRTLVIIVCTYLMSNVLGVIITIWEFIDYLHLNTNFTALHVLSVDWISVFTMIACCLRLPIYVIVQPVLRSEMKNFIAQFWTKEKMSRRMTLIENLQLSIPQTILLQHQDSDVIEFV